MTTGRINQVASSYDAVSPDARGLSRGPGEPGGRAWRAGAPRDAPCLSCGPRGGGEPLPRAERSGPVSTASAFARAKGASGDAPSANEGRSQRVRPASLEGRRADGVWLGDVDSFALGTQHRKPGSAREAWELSAPRNDGAYVRPVRCASKEPGSPRRPTTTHAQSRAPFRPRTSGPRQT